MPRKAINKDQKNNKEKKTTVPRAGRPRLVKGLKDVLPTDSRYWSFLIQLAYKMALVYDFKVVESPALETVNLASYAKDKKDLISFSLKGVPEVCLRPDLRLGLLRSYCEHNLVEQSNPLKVFTIGNTYSLDQEKISRAKKEIVYQFMGEVQPVCEAQLILICYNICSSLGLPVTIQVNNVGCPECREEYQKELTNYYRSNRSKLCEDCRKSVTKDPISILRCNKQGCKEASEEAPQTLDWLCEGCKEEFIKVLEYLDEFEIAYNLNARLFGESTAEKTVFEIWFDKEEAKEGERPSLLAFGGRHSNFLAKYFEQPVGLSSVVIQADKVLSHLRERGKGDAKFAPAEIFVAQLGEAPRRRAMVLFEDLRKSGYKVTEAFCINALKPQLERAGKIGVKHILIIGQKELIDNTVIMRDIEGGIQEIVPYDKVKEELEKKV